MTNKASFSRLAEGLSSLDETNNEQDYRYDQKQVYKPADSVSGHKTKRPENQKNHCNGDEHRRESYQVIILRNRTSGVRVASLVCIHRIDRRTDEEKDTISMVSFSGF